MAFIEVRNLFKRFGKVAAVNHINLDIEKGEMLTLLGPSGCGKTTTLRCIAGLEKPEEGDIVIDGKPMLAQGFVPPSRRGIGMVFQNYAVWPHMKVFNNVAYGLKLQKLPSKTIRDKVGKVLDLVGLGGLEDRYPGQLSGGQQQRVALARALVRNPKVLLLDEPLSNLDAKLREKMRFEIKSLVRRMGITAVYVTHDQAEAMVISDRIAVMDAGNVVQVGNAREIYERPADRFVADFIGTMNFIPGDITEVLDGNRMVRVNTEFSERLVCTLSGGMRPETGKRVYASIRPEDVQLFSGPPEETENVVEGTITNKAYLGNFLFVFVSVNGATIRVQMTHYTPEEEGQNVYLYLDPEKCMALL
jgi:iron(III) transport system ATP-binding protein